MTEGPDDVEVLDEVACEALLAEHHFGRLGFSADGWPTILPVSYVFATPDVLIRTALGAKTEFAPQQTVAFEVDDVDPEGRWGWSVLLQGPAFDITDAVDSYDEALRRLPVQPLAPGVRERWLRVSAERLSGRRFGPVPPR